LWEDHHKEKVFLDQMGDIPNKLGRPGIKAL